jgi:ureidoglycolate lyase
MTAGRPVLRPYVVEATPITDEAFAPFGDVVALGGRVVPRADERTTAPFAQWGESSIRTRDGEELALDVITRRIVHPVELTRLYRHHKAPQVQIPLRNVPILILVAPAGLEFRDPGDLESLQTFITDGSVGVNIGIDVWHEGAYPIVHEVDLVNLQGRDHPNDTEMIQLDRLLGVAIHIRL